jgi:hypothetical protein
MRKTGHYDVLVTEFVRTVVIFLLSMMILIVALFLPDRLVKVTTLIGTILFVIGSILFVSSGWKFWRVVEFLD